ncbi:phage portal protein [Nesterenkonia haasae]|uniref:phage portal protein n=1 Tax=Nesterenkonia haasae TaxID=2587813 RepID=UPI0013917697|nr:phage portal protein [Nesterenkonia haasae]NDK31189.1 phage portal protein [Nesterenkonia haasae]
MLSAQEAATKTQELYDCLARRRPMIDNFDRYYEGEQPLKYASKEWAKFHKERYKGFSDNWCAVVIDALNERLRVSGLQVGSEPDDAERQLWDDWQRNDMDAQSSQGFLQTIGSTRSAVIVWGDENDEPVYTWEHPSQVYVEYSAEFVAKPLYAIKAWQDDKREYATLYTDEQVFKWQRPLPMEGIKDGRTSSGLYVNAAGFSATGSWEPRQGEGDDTWPLSHPLGELPVVEIQNRPRLKRGPISDISGVMAMQDAINLLWAYLFGAADHASFPARVIMGQEPPKVPMLDKDGQKIGEKAIDIEELRQGRMLWLTGDKSSIDQFDSAKLDVFTDVIDININHVAAQSRTPAHYFIANKGMSNLNGETLKATETPLVKKGGEFQLYSSNGLAKIFRLGAKVRGNNALADSIGPHSIQWADMEIRSEAQRSDALIKMKQMGYPMRHLLKMNGHSPNEIDTIMKQIEAEQAADPLYAAEQAVRRGADYEPDLTV